MSHNKEIPLPLAIGPAFAGKLIEHISYLPDELVAIHGSYDGTATYRLGSVVVFNGELYMAKDTILSVEPTTTASWWKMSIEGESTDLSEKVVRYQGNYSPVIAYKKNDLLNSSGIIYITLRDAPAGTAVTDTGTFLPVTGSGTNSGTDTGTGTTDLSNYFTKAETIDEIEESVTESDLSVTVNTNNHPPFSLRPNDDGSTPTGKRVFTEVLTLPSTIAETNLQEDRHITVKYLIASNSFSGSLPVFTTFTLMDSSGGSAVVGGQTHSPEEGIISITFILTDGAFQFSNSEDLTLEIAYTFGGQAWTGAITIVEARFMSRGILHNDVVDVVDGVVDPIEENIINQLTVLRSQLSQARDSLTAADRVKLDALLLEIETLTTPYTIRLFNGTDYDEVRTFTTTEKEVRVQVPSGINNVVLFRGTASFPLRAAQRIASTNIDGVTQFTYVVPITGTGIIRVVRAEDNQVLKVVQDIEALRVEVEALQSILGSAGGWVSQTELRQETITSDERTDLALGSTVLSHTTLTDAGTGATAHKQTPTLGSRGLEIVAVQRNTGALTGIVPLVELSTSNGNVTLLRVDRDKDELEVIQNTPATEEHIDNVETFLRGLRNEDPVILQTYLSEQHFTASSATASFNYSAFGQSTRTKIDFTRFENDGADDYVFEDLFIDLGAGSVDPVSREFATGVGNEMVRITVSVDTDLRRLNVGVDVLTPVATERDSSNRRDNGVWHVRASYDRAVTTPASAGGIVYNRIRTFRTQAYFVGAVRAQDGHVEIVFPSSGIVGRYYEGAYNTGLLLSAYPIDGGTSINLYSDTNYTEAVEVTSGTATARDLYALIAPAAAGVYGIGLFQSTTATEQVVEVPYSIKARAFLDANNMAITSGGGATTGSGGEARHVLYQKTLGAGATGPDLRYNTLTFPAGSDKLGDFDRLVIGYVFSGEVRLGTFFPKLLIATQAATASGVTAGRHEVLRGGGNTDYSMNLSDTGTVDTGNTSTQAVIQSQSTQPAADTLFVIGYIQN